LQDGTDGQLVKQLWQSSPEEAITATTSTLAISFAIPFTTKVIIVIPSISITTTATIVNVLAGISTAATVIQLGRLLRGVGITNSSLDFSSTMPRDPPAPKFCPPPPPLAMVTFGTDMKHTKLLLGLATSMRVLYSVKIAS